MRILVIISVLAAAGLLWASLAAAQHIRTARRRRRSAAGGFPATLEPRLSPAVDTPTGNPAPPKPRSPSPGTPELFPSANTTASTSSIEIRAERAEANLPHPPFQPRAGSLRVHG